MPVGRPTILPQEQQGKKFYDYRRFEGVPSHIRAQIPMEMGPFSKRNNIMGAWLTPQEFDQIKAGIIPQSLGQPQGIPQQPQPQIAPQPHYPFFVDLVRRQPATATLIPATQNPQQPTNIVPGGMFGRVERRQTQPTVANQPNVVPGEQNPQAPQPPQWNPEQRAILELPQGRITPADFHRYILGAIPRNPNENFNDYLQRLNQQLRNNPFLQEFSRRQNIPGQFDEDQLGQAERGRLINELVRRAPRRTDAGESDQEYVDRLRPGPAAAFRNLFGVGDQDPLINPWGSLPERFRGPVQPNELRAAEEQPDVAERLRNQNQVRLDRIARENPGRGLQQGANQINAAIRPLQQQNQPPRNRQEAIDQLVNGNPYRPGESNQEYVNRLNRVAQDPNNNNNPFSSLPNDQQNPVTLQDLALEQPRGPRQGGGGGGDQPQVGPAQAQQDPRATFLIDRMNSLHGQIRRANRRATVPELSQIRNLYGDLLAATQNQIPAGLAPQLQRIRRDFNEQARLLNVQALDERMPERNVAQQVNVPVDQQGNVSMNAYQTQFPHLFNQLGGLLTEEQAQRAIRDNFPRDQREAEMNVFRKIRSDINQVRWANNQGELGYAHRMGEVNRRDEMERIKREDAQYRTTPAYRNTVIPQGPVTQQAAQQQPVTPGQMIDEDVPYVTQQIRQGQTVSSSGQPVTTTTGVPAAQSQQRAQQAPAIGEPIPEQVIGRRHGRVGEVLLGGNTRLLQIPQYTPAQRDWMRELGLMGMERLRQAYQPMTPDVQQQRYATSALQNTLNRIANNDLVGARQELALAGGPSNVLQAANLPGLQDLQQPVLNQAAPQPQGQQQPAVAQMTPQQIRQAINRMQAIDDNAWRQGSMEGARPYTPQEQAEFNQLYAQVTAQNPDAIRGVRQDLFNLGRFYTGQPIGAQQPVQIQPQVQQNLPPYNAIIPPQQAFPPLQPMGQQQGGLAGLLNIPGNVQQGYQQGGGGLGGVLNAAQQGAQGLANIARTGQQAARIPGQVQQAYRQGGGGFGGVLNAMQQGAQGVANLGNQRPGWEYGPAYGMQYPHPLPWTAANELNRFYEQTVPTLAERFTAAGGGQRSAAFQGALGAAGRGLGLGLASMGEQQNQQNLQNQQQQTQQQLYAQQQAFNQNQALREFAENQRRYGQQQQLGQQQFQFNTGMSMLQPSLNQQTASAILPGQQGILPGIIQGTGSAVRGVAQAML